jgi:hypothetical protein
MCVHCQALLWKDQQFSLVRHVLITVGLIALAVLLAIVVTHLLRFGSFSALLSRDVRSSRFHALGWVLFFALCLLLIRDVRSSRVRAHRLPV